MPVFRCPNNNKWRIGDGPCIYESEIAANRALVAIKIKEAQQALSVIKEILKDDQMIAELTHKPRSSFTPPESGDAPQGLKDILKEVYQDCRFRNHAPVIDSPEDKKSKESCAKIAWFAVKKAGYRKNAEGKWILQNSSDKKEEENAKRKKRKEKKPYE